MSLVTAKEQSASSIPTAEYDVVVVGAGPYGLSTATHLLNRKLNVAVFGKPLHLWREHMPEGMYLRSHWRATNLAHPQKGYEFERFLQSSSYPLRLPVPIQAFIDYGLWFQKQAVPAVDETYIASIEKQDGLFQLDLVDGRRVYSRAVVMAVGLRYYARRPEEYAGLPADLVSHTVDYNGFSQFAGKQVAVLGGGQSGVESAALLHEAGAEVHLITRYPIHWLAPDRNDERSLLARIRAPWAGIAPGWKNWVLEHLPYFFYRFPQERKDHYIETHYQAAASDWLHERVVGKAHLYEATQIEKAAAFEGHLALHLSNSRVVKVDHLLLATGYAVDATRLPMLHSSLLAMLQLDERNNPVLNHWFESSVPGLYFIGITALRSYGPLFRFVVGAKAAAERVSRAAARHVAREHRRARARG
jgi:cation diffusion facilitator CzcD-associated flavoprotein CzcO